MLGLNADAIALIDELGGVAGCGVLSGGVCGTGFGGVFFPGLGDVFRGRSMMIGVSGGDFASDPATFTVGWPNFFPRFDTVALSPRPVECGNVCVLQ